MTRKTFIASVLLAFVLAPSAAFAELRRVQINVLGMD
jgi:hypothetical protein